MSFTAASLRAALEAQVPAGAAGLCVALSGGAHSSCLLAASAQLRPAFRSLPLRAVHVDHGLQAQAAQFRQDCRALADRFGVPLTILDAAVDTRAGVSIEAAAREARYAALAADLGADECLLTAHHCEDQAETFLLQALRGAGLKGLSSMPACRALGAGWHVRPLLEVPERELQNFAAQSAIRASVDPMNTELRFDRAYLREKVWPGVRARWPAAAIVLERAARHLAAGQELLEAIAAEDWGAMQDGDSLSLPHLRRLPQARRLNVLRYWIDAHAAIALPATRLGEALRQLLEARTDRQPAIVWEQHALRRYRDRVFLTAAAPPQLAREIPWQIAPDAVLELGRGLGRLRCVVQPGGWAREKLPARITIAKRRGGEALKPAARAATQSVQHLVQALGVLPWMRDALPYIHAGDALIGVADLWRDARWCTPMDQTGLAVVWEQAPDHL